MPKVCPLINAGMMASGQAAPTQQIWEQARLCLGDKCGFWSQDNCAIVKIAESLGNQENHLDNIARAIWQK